MKTLLTRELKAPRIAQSPLFHGLGLLLVGNLWLVVAAALLGAGKGIGEFSPIWWTIYLGAPLPLSLWGVWCFYHLGPHFRQATLFGRTVLLGGLFAACYPAILIACACCLSP